MQKSNQTKSHEYLRVFLSFSLGSSQGVTMDGWIEILFQTRSRRIMSKNKKTFRKHLLLHFCFQPSLPPESVVLRILNRERKTDSFWTFIFQALTATYFDLLFEVDIQLEALIRRPHYRWTCCWWFKSSMSVRFGSVRSGLWPTTPTLRRLGQRPVGGLICQLRYYSNLISIRKLFGNNIFHGSLHLAKFHQLNLNRCWSYLGTSWIWTQPNSTRLGSARPTVNRVKCYATTHSHPTHFIQTISFSHTDHQLRAKPLYLETSKKTS